MIQIELIQFFSGFVKIHLSLYKVSDSVLILLEKQFILDLKIFSFRESELSNTKIVFQSRDFSLVSVDFADIELDVMSCG